MNKVLVVVLFCAAFEIAFGRNIVKRDCCTQCTTTNCQSNNNNCQSNCNNCQSNCNNCQTNCNNCQTNCEKEEQKESPIEKTPVLIPFPPAQPVVTSTNNTNINNYTAEITINNVINTINNITVPVSLNSTNINNISIYPAYDVEPQREVLNNTNCCVVIHPKTCDPNGYCYVKSHWECSDICKGQVVTIEEATTSPVPGIPVEPTTNKPVTTEIVPAPTYPPWRPICQNYNGYSPCPVQPAPAPAYPPWRPICQNYNGYFPCSMQSAPVQIPLPQQNVPMEQISYVSQPVPLNATNYQAYFPSPIQEQQQIVIQPVYQPMNMPLQTQQPQNFGSFFQQQQQYRLPNLPIYQPVPVPTYQVSQPAVQLPPPQTTCQTIRNYPYRYCGNYQTQNCETCYFCNGELNPQECYSNSECSFYCQTVMRNCIPYSPDYAGGTDYCLY